MTDRELACAAISASEYSYAPYSGCRVGAALLTKNGKVFTGCNIENASFGATVCAERTALFKAVSEGETEFEKLAVYGKTKDCADIYFYPCGICRQTLSEFCNEDFVIITAKSPDDFVADTLGNILKNGFKLD